MSQKQSCNQEIKPARTENDRLDMRISKTSQLLEKQNSQNVSGKQSQAKVNFSILNILPEAGTLPSVVVIRLVKVDI